jgi:hypothetical protein
LRKAEERLILLPMMALKAKKQGAMFALRPLLVKRFTEVAMILNVAF